MVVISSQSLGLRGCYVALLPTGDPLKHAGDDDPPIDTAIASAEDHGMIAGSKESAL
jgi:hypothetical protein